MSPRTAYSILALILALVFAAATAKAASDKGRSPALVCCRGIAARSRIGRGTFFRRGSFVLFGSVKSIITVGARTVNQKVT
jgi:hypothetical protein